MEYVYTYVTVWSGVSEGRGVPSSSTDHFFQASHDRGNPEDDENDPNIKWLRTKDHSSIVVRFQHFSIDSFFLLFLSFIPCTTYLGRAPSKDLGTDIAQRHIGCRLFPILLANLRRFFPAKCKTCPTLTREIEVSNCRSTHQCCQASELQDQAKKECRAHAERFFSISKFEFRPFEIPGSAGGETEERERAFGSRRWMDMVNCMKNNNTESHPNNS